MSSKQGSDDLRDQVLRNADALFCSRGVQAVGMDDVRSATGVSLKRLYQLFPGKEPLVEACLRYRDAHWWADLTGYVDRVDDPRQQIMAVYDWLEIQFAEPGFRGCPWINAYGELSAVAPEVARLVRAHKDAFRSYLQTLIRAAGLPQTLTEPLLLLAEGSMVIAGIFGEAGSGTAAKAAASQLITAADASHASDTSRTRVAEPVPAARTVR